MMFFFFNDTATTEIYTLSLHDALPISRHVGHDDRLAEDDAAEDVADRPVGRAVHPLEAELLDAGLVRGDRRALDADAVLLDRVRGVDGDLVVGLEIGRASCRERV